MEAFDEEEEENDPLILELLAGRQAYENGNEWMILGTLDRILDEAEGRKRTTCTKCGTAYVAQQGVAVACPGCFMPAASRSMPPPPSRLPQASPQHRSGKTKPAAKECNRNLSWRLPGRGDSYMFTSGRR